jgi:hypothetical protein
MTFASLVHPRLDAIPKPRLDGWAKGSLALLTLLGLGAVAGGAALVSQPDGSVMGFDTAILGGSPFADFTVPGLILGGLFGIGSFVVVALALARSRIAPFLAFAIGCGQMIWIVVELAIIGQFSFLHPTFFGVGLLIAATSVRWGWPTFQAWRRS